MAGRGGARRIRVGEEVLVVLPERESESPLANRRQVGACSARARALQHALAEAPSEPAAAFWRLDVAPLTVTSLSGRAGRWNLHCGGPLTPRQLP
ncbi:hypothetical protein ACWEPB_06045 [Kitasatospora cineracea]